VVNAVCLIRGGVLPWKQNPPEYGMAGAMKKIIFLFVLIGMGAMAFSLLKKMNADEPNWDHEHHNDMGVGYPPADGSD
jgi:hypothetical protein